MAKGKAPPITLKVGDPAPDFSGRTNNGGSIALGELRGKCVVLYFYPKDDTPGCTKEACGFRDQHAALVKAGAVVIGVSPDPVKAHDKFVAKFQLPFLLLSDEDHRIAETYGVWGEKQFMGRTYQGVHRATFLIDAAGRLRAIWPQVKPENHAAEVLAALREV
ncbi:MAG: thioredoxin-dependent thiol peroxidase [Verrucomicrobiales bacterium]|nr:thioredoxin-dependent thiol peroxidase [Verrucomicrobiales bacterium]